MKTFAVLLVCLCLGIASAVPSWTRSSGLEVNDQETIAFKMAMKPQNLEYLQKMFWQISDSESPLFGKFLTNNQIADLISLPEEDIAKVESYLTKDSGKFCDVDVTRSIHRDYLLVHTCAAQAKVIFPNLQLAVYEKEDIQRKLLRSVALLDLAENLTFLGVPQELHQYLVGVHDITDVPPHYERFGLPSPTQPWLKSDRQLSITEIMDYFNVTQKGITDEALAADHPQVRQAVVELDNSAFVASGLAKFQERYHIRKDAVQKVVGTEEVSGGTIEADLDVQTITAMAQGAQTWSFVFGGYATWVDVVEGVMSTEGAPKVISVCWSGLASQMGQSAVNAAETQLMKLGLAGFSWFQDAGDAGPTLNPEACDTFDSKYPSSSQYVVSVGGNKIVDATGVQAAWFRSSGGFSDYLPRLPFQEEAVEHYLKVTTLPPNPQGHRYQTGGRAFPDVSGFAAFYPMVYNGTFQAIGSGTSAATPQFAGIITLIQIQRYQKGYGPLGPLVQPLYKLKKGVGFDVVSGETYALSRSGCTGDLLPGFKAAEGWDPATGLGSPKYDVLLEQLLTLGEKTGN